MMKRTTLKRLEKAGMKTLWLRLSAISKSRRKTFFSIERARKNSQYYEINRLEKRQAMLNDQEQLTNKAIALKIKER